MDKKIDTLCVQAGYTPKNGEPRQIPIVQSTTFKYDSSPEMAKLFNLEASGYFYTRLQNPTNDYVAAKIAALEGGTAGMLTSSGQAANFYAVFNIASCGDHVVSSSAIYGGTYNLFAVTMKKMGIDFTFVSPDCTEEQLELFFYYCSPNVVLMTLPLFMLCKKVRVNSQPIQKALANLTVCGFGVYMIHYFFTGPSVVLARMCHVPVGLQIPFAAVVAFLVSWGLVILLRRLTGKYARYVVG